MVKSLLKTYLFCIALLAFLFSVNSVSAQSIPNASSQAIGIEIVSSPENPKPNQDVSLSLSSYSLNIDSATVRWYINDVLKKEGIGTKEFNLKTGKSGDLIDIRAEVFTNDGRSFEQSISINPAEVDLVIEASSYVPPLYKGRAYFVSQGIAKVIAIPDIVQNGRHINAKDLNYKWTQNGIVLGSQSGTGKNTVIIEGTVPIRDINIELSVIDASGKVVATESTLISPSNSKILFYEDSSLYGVMSNRAISGNYSIGGKEEVKIIAKPYFFDISGVSTKESKYRWSVNGAAINLSGPQNEMILRQDGKTSGGTASVSLKIENQVRIFQFATSNFNITFGN